ncbi:hypothetical protein OS493_030375 [Desmophyllum pertusum]|uniref:RING-type domain-containing protein n=1 Tax=Desmophyllum pertusum TaxID=174260 RepID=A0A9W9Z8L0_9CNID|nr:hypothetical protein OS493_030375 [Desmophyllum pertusum]
MATPCGHTFCGNCVANFDLNGVKTCQMCREPVLSYCRNLFADQMMANMKGKCDSCSTMIAIELAEDHVHQCTDILEECLYQQKITRKDRLAHMQVCPKEEVTRANAVSKTKKRRGDGHKKNDCRFGQVDCPLMCEAMVTRYLVPSHTLVCTKVVAAVSNRWTRQVFKKGGYRTSLYR